MAREAGRAAAPGLRLRDGRPATTDGGNLLYDIAGGAIAEPATLAAALKAVTGVVEHGLFIGLTEAALVAGPDGVRRLQA